MKKLKAFTLIEILIVIIVFCVGILAVLLWLSQTLRNKDYAMTQIKSAFFAREWIELIFNLRDANYHKELPWNCIFNYATINPTKVYEENVNPFCDKLLEPGTILKISMWKEDKYLNTEVWALQNDFEKDFEEFQIYLHTWSNNWFTYDYQKDNGEKTWFARYLKVEQVVTEAWDINDKLLKIESHVLYQRWTLTGEKVMETFIWNYEF